MPTKSGTKTPRGRAKGVPDQIYYVFIKASPERIWDAITKPEFTARYYYGSDVEVDLRPGGKFWYHAPDRSRLLIDGQVIEFDPPRRLVATFHSLWGEMSTEQPSRVTWEIEPQAGDYCKVTLIHDQLDGSPLTARNIAGANRMLMLSGMKTLLETGAPLVDFTAALRQRSAQPETKNTAQEEKK